VNSVEASAHVFEGVREVGAGFAVDAHADANAHLEVLRNICGAGGEAAVGQRIPGHGRAGFGGLLEDVVVCVDEVAEDELVVEQAAVDHPAELGALLSLVVGGLDVMGLIAQVELFHHGRFHDRLLVSVVEGGRAADHDAEKVRVGRLGGGPVEEDFEACASLLDGQGGRYAVGAVAVNEAYTRLFGAAELRLFELVVQVGGFGPSSVGEVVGGGYAVLEMIE